MEKNELLPMADFCRSEDFELTDLPEAINMVSTLTDSIDKYADDIVIFFTSAGIMTNLYETNIKILKEVDI